MVDVIGKHKLVANEKVHRCLLEISKSRNDYLKNLNILVGTLKSDQDFGLGHEYIKNLKSNEKIHIKMEKSMVGVQNFMKLAVKNQKTLKSLVLDEGTINISNQILEWLASSGKLEELSLYDEQITITFIPSFYLQNLKRLFICQDQLVKITDDDLKFMVNLIDITLSHNNEITNIGLEYCKKLKYVFLFENKKITKNKRYIIFVSDNHYIDDIPDNILDYYYKKLHF